jgi:DNA-binding NtrC family response regulator
MSLSRYTWPGNVRELKSVARRFAISNRGRERTVVDDRLQPMLDTAASVGSKPAAVPPPLAAAPSDSEPPAPKREAVQLKDQDVLDALRDCEFESDRTARELGVSRSWLHARMNSLPGARKAKDLKASKIQTALDGNRGEIEPAAK